MKTKLLALLVLSSLIHIGCETKKASHFSILPDANIYTQDGIYEPRKIDILWVIDNSHSMNTSQVNLSTHFQSFMDKFQTLKFDYHIAVAATDSWRTLYDPNSPNHSLLRDGDDSEAGHSGVFVIKKNTPDVVGTFMINAMLGVLGTKGSSGNYIPAGDERAFQSMMATLENTSNKSLFRRSDAFLAVIIVSDEDDFSRPNVYSAGNPSTYDNPNLHTVQSYVDFLDIYTGRTSPQMPSQYSVSTITVQNEGCRQILDTDGFTRYPGVRYMQLAEATGGHIGSLCAPFTDTLASISDSIVNYTSIFPLTRVPIVETIKIHVNGVLVSLDPENGWTYRASDNSIWFHGESIPPSGANIRIDFDPVSIKM